MSMHVSDEVLLAFLDREVEASERSRIEGHVGGCAACAARLAGLRAAARHAREALEELDEEPPWTDLPAELAAAQRDEDRAGSVRPIDSAVSVRRSRRLSRRALGVAASMVLLLAAGAWAIPGSPVRSWLSRSVTAVVELFGSGATEATPSDERDPTDTAGQDLADSGVSVEPLNGQVRISVRGVGAGTVVRVRLTDADFASVRGANTGGSYTVGPGSIDVAGPSGEMVIEIPSRVTGARVEVDGLVVARKRGAELFSTPAADSSMAQILLETGG